MQFIELYLIKRSAVYLNFDLQLCSWALQALSLPPLLAVNCGSLRLTLSSAFTLFGILMFHWRRYIYPCHLKSVDILYGSRNDFSIDSRYLIWSFFFGYLGTLPPRLGRPHGSSPSVIVVGGGISGVAAARFLQNASFKVRILMTLNPFHILIYFVLI